MARVLKALHLPISSAVMREAGLHPKFCRTIIKIFQANQHLITNLERRICDQSASIAIPPLNEEKVVQAASDFIGELFVFSVAGGVLIFSRQKKARLEAREKEIYKQESEAHKQGIEEGIEDITCKIEEYKQRLADLDFKVKQLLQGAEKEDLDRPTETSGTPTETSSPINWTSKLKMGISKLKL